MRRDKACTILLVEDETHLARGLIYNLQAEGYRVLHAADGRQALEMVAAGGFDLAVLDLILPFVSGYEVLKEIRKRHPRLPVLILSAKLEERDRIAGLELGADDYVVKPFHLKELLLRIQGMVRRLAWYEGGEPVAEYAFGESRVNFQTMRAQGPGGKRGLTQKEAHLLRMFMENEGRVLSRQRLLSEVWGYPPDMVTRTLDTFIARLRSYFEPDPKNPVHFRSVRGVGYSFHAEPG